MVTDSLTDSAKRLLEVFEAQSRELPYLFVSLGGTPHSNAASLRSALASALPTHIDEALAHLARNEPEVIRRRNLRARHEEEDQRAAEARVPLSEEEMRPVLEEAREAQRLAEYRASTEGRLEAIEGVLGEIRDALAKR